MILQAFSQVSNIACAIYRKILLNIAVGYSWIKCTTSGMITGGSGNGMFICVHACY